MRTPLVRTLAAVAFALVLVGCGGSSGGDAADEPTTTKAPADAEAPDTTDAPADGTSTTAAGGAASTTAAPAAGDLCEPLAVIIDFDQQTSALVAAGDWPAIQTYYVDHTAEMVAAYDEAIALDTALTEDLRKVRAITAMSADLAKQSDSLMAFGSALGSQPGMMAASQSANAVQRYAQEECGL